VERIALKLASSLAHALKTNLSRPSKAAPAVSDRTSSPVAEIQSNTSPAQSVRSSIGGRDDSTHSALDAAAIRSLAQSLFALADITHPIDSKASQLINKVSEQSRNELEDSPGNAQVFQASPSKTASGQDNPDEALTLSALAFSQTQRSSHGSKALESAFEPEQGDAAKRRPANMHANGEASSEGQGKLEKSDASLHTSPEPPSNSHRSGP